MANVNERLKPLPRFLSTYRAVASVPLQKGAAALRASPSIRDFFIFMASSARSLAVCRLLTAATLLYEATAGLDPHSARSFLSDAGLWTHLDQIETGSNSGRPSFLLASGDEFPLPSFRYTVLCSRRAPRTAQPYASATPHMLRQKSSTGIAMSTGKGNLMAKGT